MLTIARRSRKVSSSVARKRRRDGWRNVARAWPPAHCAGRRRSRRVRGRSSRRRAAGVRRPASVRRRRSFSGRALRKRSRPARSGDCTSARNRASSSSGPAARAGDAGAAGAVGQFIHSVLVLSDRRERGQQGSGRPIGAAVVLGPDAVSIRRFISSGVTLSGGRGSAIGLAPPLVSMRTSESIRLVWIFTDEICAMWIDSSCLPIHRGVYWTTALGVISTCVGSSRLPAAQPAGAEHGALRERPPLQPDDGEEQDQRRPAIPPTTPPQAGTEVEGGHSGRC